MVEEEKHHDLPRRAVLNNSDQFPPGYQCRGRGRSGTTSQLPPSSSKLRHDPAKKPFPRDYSTASGGSSNKKMTSKIPNLLRYHGHGHQHQRPTTTKELALTTNHTSSFDAKLSRSHKRHPPSQKFSVSATGAALTARQHLLTNNHQSNIRADRAGSNNNNINEGIDHYGSSQHRRSDVTQPTSMKTSKTFTSNDHHHAPVLVGPLAAVSIRGVKPRHPNYPNQDMFVIAPGTAAAGAGFAQPILAVVCDGHGKYGHMVARCARDCLAIELHPHLTHMGKWNPSEIARIHKDAYRKAAAQLRHIDTSYSGTTASTVAVVDRHTKLVVSHVGDSRVVLGKSSSNRKEPRFVAVELARDHKPDDPEERSRILAHGGCVTNAPLDELGNPMGSARVWRSGGRSPGLAMSRSLGDAVAHDLGVSSEPDVTCIKLVPQDLFVIAASDGVWEFISSQEAVDLVSSMAGPDIVNSAAAFASPAAPLATKHTQQAVERLCSLAHERWCEFSDHTTIDDITCVVMILATGASARATVAV